MDGLSMNGEHAASSMENGFDVSHQRAIPEEMRAMRHWIRWQLEPIDKNDPLSKRVKVPYQAQRGHESQKAKSDTPTTWTTFDEAVRFGQIGFQFGTDEQLSGIVGIDYDHCAEDDWQDFAQWLESELDSYTSVSQSGTGKHTYLKGTVPSKVKIDRGQTAGVKHIAMEIYDRGQFFTETGRPTTLRPMPLRSNQEVLTALHTALGLYKKKVLDWLERYKGTPAAKEFVALWMMSETDANQSARDFALASRVARWARGDEAVADMLFRMSGRYRGERVTKWDEQHRSRNEDDEGRISDRFNESAPLTYGEMTIGRACRTVRKNLQIAEQVAGDLDPETVKLLQTAEVTETGNAECFAAVYGEQLRYNHTSERWARFEGTVWRELPGKMAPTEEMLDVLRRRRALATLLDDDDAKRMAAAMLQHESRGHIVNALELAKAKQRIRTQVEAFDTRPALLAVKNGVMNIETGEFRAATPDDMLMLQLGVAYDPAATCPRWEQFLVEVFEGDMEKVAYIQRAMGYTLTPFTKEQVMFLNTGAGGNGKSLMLGTLHKLFGDYAQSAPFSAFDGETYNRPRETMARLRGARFVSVIESREDRRLDEAAVKSATGGDIITGEFKYGHEFQYAPQFKLWMAVNRKPVIVGTDKGIWRRIQLIEFNRTFEGGAEDKDLASKLEAELPGILNWALAGLHAWQAQGLAAPASVTAASEEYRRESNTVRTWLESECHLIDAETQTQVQQEKLKVADCEGRFALQEVAYQQYREWAKHAGIQYPFSLTAWALRMQELGHKSERKRVEYSRGEVKQKAVYFTFSCALPRVTVFD